MRKKKKEKGTKSAYGNEQMPDVPLCDAKADFTLTAHMKNQIHSEFPSCSDSETTRSVSHE